MEENILVPEKYWIPVWWKSALYYLQIYYIVIKFA